MSYEKVEQAKSLTIGTKQTAKAVEQGLAEEVVVAKDADKRITSKIVALCNEKGIPVSYVESMRRLGKACGIEVGAAVTAIKRCE